MPGQVRRGVRGTTHARLHQKVVITEGLWTGEKIFCAWEDCDNDGYFCHRVRVNYGQHPTGEPWVTTYIFCSERHRQYWIHSHHNNGHLPQGYRLTIL